MRAIKFRQWAGDTFYYWGIGIGDNTFVGPVSGGRINAQNTVHQQYTGLKDRNGREIYEGDVLKFQTNSRGEVYWGDCGWWVKNDWRDEALDYVRDLTAGKFEIVGNIYENPELLEAK